MLATSPFRAPLRIGIVTTSFPLSDGACAGIFIERLISQLPSDVIATVLAPLPDTEITVRTEAPYAVHAFAYGPRTWLRLAHRPGGIPDALRRRDPALLLLPLFLSAMFLASARLAGRVDLMHGNWSVPALIAALAARCRGRKSIATLRGEDVNRAKTSLLSRWLLRACLSINHYTVVVSEAMRQDVSGLYPAYSERVLFIPNGVDRPESAHRSGFNSPLRLLTIGSLIQRKRIDVIIEALAKLRVSTHLRIVGDGPERSHLQDLARVSGVEKHVEFLGAVPPQDVGRLLSWADLFVFSSEAEGRPNVILEAMAAGLPVVATDIPGVRELLWPDAGKLYPVGDADALAGIIRLAIQHPQHVQQLAEIATQRTQRLTWRDAAIRYAALYRQLARASSS